MPIPKEKSADSLTLPDLSVNDGMVKCVAIEGFIKWHSGCFL